jgi:hypothetical protein
MTYLKRSAIQPLLRVLFVSVAFGVFSTQPWNRPGHRAAAADPAEPRLLVLPVEGLPVAPIPDELGVSALRRSGAVGPLAAIRQAAAESAPPELGKGFAPAEPRVANIPSSIDSPLLRDYVPRREAADLNAAGSAAEPLTRRDKTPVAASAGLPAWQEPSLLLEKLAELNSADVAGRWAAETSHLVRALGVAMSQGSPDSAALVERLEKSAAQANTMAASIHDPQTAHRLRQAGHALARRLGVWGEITAIGNQASAETAVTRADASHLALCLAEVESLIGNSSEGRAWRKYLLVDALQEWSKRQPSKGNGITQELAREALVRMTKAPLSADQRFFVSSGPVAALRTELRRLTAEPVSSMSLLNHLEQYEQSRQSVDARLLARDCQDLIVSADTQCRELGQLIESNYRNANVRMAVSAELLNRLMPKRKPEAAPVHDSVLGVPVHGRSVTSSQVAVRLLPDANHVRLALEVTGQVDSATNATSGPATFYNHGTAYYTARKPMEIDLRGIRLETVDVDVRNDMRLQDVQTDLDGVPLLGPIANRIARGQHELNHDAADREVRAKVAYQARQRIDAETTAQLSDFAHRFNSRVLAPLYNLALEPTMIGAETTEQRFLMRIRLAGDEQVGSHTPRPQAPSDSLASVQVHESAINNALENLNLDGRSFTLPELSKQVSDRLCAQQVWESDPENNDVVITFVAQDAVRVVCQDGQMILTLSLARLAKGKTHWKDFQVRVFFRPQANGRSAELVRDGVIHLIGPLSMTSRIALQGIFSKTFPRRTNWNLTPERLLNSAELADSAITQFTIDDGWLAAAFGPKPVASPVKQTAVRPTGMRR